MYLTYRPAALADIPDCFSMLPPGFSVGPAPLQQMQGMWREWLRDGALQLTIIEDEERERGRRAVGFGCSVFVTDEFVQQVQHNVKPPVALEVARRSFDDNPVVLTLTQIRRHNSSDGLNLLILVIGWASDLRDADELSRVKAKLMDAFYYTHAGYKIKDVMQEVYSIEELQRAGAIGATPRSDYAQFYASNAPAPSLRAYLTGASRTQIREGSYLWPIFLYSPPRFFFSPGEQEVLKRALIDKTDTQIAEALHVSLASIHKRWQAILDRAGGVDVKWLPDEASAPSAGSGRGVEKRRHLLSYLRSHPEELRPIAAVKKGEGS